MNLMNPTIDGWEENQAAFRNAVSKTCNRIITNSELFITIIIADFSISKGRIFEPKDVQNLNLTACEKGSTEKMLALKIKPKQFDMSCI